MTLPVLIVGAGGHGRVLADLAFCLGKKVLGFLDRNLQLHGKEIDGIEVLGGDECLAGYPPKSVMLINGIGPIVNSEVRYEAYNRLRSLGYEFDVLCHPKAIIGGSVTLGPGAQIMAGCIVQCGAQIGENSVINSGAIVEHDAVVGTHSHLAPRAVICGGVRIGERCHIGVGAVVVQGLSVGDNALVAAGAVVVKDVPSRMRVAGVPASCMR
jgi:sugar O-acyltransferase (sialic acid O-acetyltransferase NeuD family)